MKTQTIDIEVFADILCVWAYGAQVQIDRLKQEFGNKISLRYRFIPLFASTDLRIVEGWKNKGGTAGFSAHTLDVVSAWSHVTVHKQIWLQNRPASSTTAHTYLKAVQLLEQSGEISSKPVQPVQIRTPFEELMWRLRCHFFEDNNNIGHRKILDQAAEELSLPLKKIHHIIENGDADAAIHQDIVARDKYLIPGSPTLVLNGGRQRLYGNVSYRIIEANVQELMLDTRTGHATEC